MRDSIKFDHENFTLLIAFLDALIYIAKNRQQKTTLHYKSTNTHNYLHKRSYLKHLKDSLHYTQVIRLRRIYTDDNQLHWHNGKLKQQFSA